MVYQLVLLMGEILMRFHRVSIYRPTAFFAALIFALHPLNTESVTYISSRSSLFATFFYLLSLILLFRGFLARHPLRDEKPKTGTLNFFGSAFALLLGALSKEIIITWPVLAFLFLGEMMSGNAQFGGALVLSGVIGRGILQATQTKKGRPNE